MFNQPEISIIIPVYNTSSYLGKAIESTLNQTYQNIEIIIIDDGSTDNSGKICDQYSINDMINKIILDRNQKVEKYGQVSYNKFMRDNNQQSANKKGFWTQAKLV